jgi:hypothetical protein
LSAALWLSVLVLSGGLAYSIIFSEVTLALDRTLSDGDLGSGYQAALLPPWQVRLSLLVYALALAVTVLAWYRFGVVRGIATVVALFGCSLAWRAVLPKGHSRHYLKLIVISMGRRYADWVRSGDSVRAAAMASLIRKMGLDLPTGIRPRPETSA